MTTLYLGLMSGTSMDGIDVALVNVKTHQLLGGITVPYPQTTYRWLQSVVNGENQTIHALYQLNHQIGKAFAQAACVGLNTFGVPIDAVLAIGSHGQTIAHHPEAEIPYTIQLGCGHVIASETGLPVITDFRTRDLVLGGQGAPLAPIYHQALFEAHPKPMAIVNIGGVANVSLLSSNAKTISGYDVGPGNCLLDAWIQCHLQQPFDAQGRWAAGGKPNQDLLTHLLADPYFALPSPKSLDKNYFSLRWLASRLQNIHDSPQNVQATLLYFTARAIVDQIKTDVVICGGGAHNDYLLQVLQQLLPKNKVCSSQAHGINPDFIEAMMCAWLAYQTMEHIPLHLMSITGACQPAILGVIYPGSPSLQTIGQDNE